MKRIFIAINLPTEIKKELESLEKEIAKMFPGEIGRGLIKWVKPENLHITLLFIGAVREEEIPRLCQIVEEVRGGVKPLSVKFTRVCYGPPKTMPPRLIWVETERNLEMSKLAEEIKQKMAEADILRKIEERPFSPHITLGRIKTWQWRQIEPEERPEIDREIDLSFEVKSVEVMESVLKRTGAEYKILKSISLEK